MTNLRRPQRVLRTTWMRAFSPPWHRTLLLRGTISPHISFATPRRLVESSPSSCWLRSNSLFGFPSSACRKEHPPLSTSAAPWRTTHFPRPRRPLSPARPHPVALHPDPRSKSPPTLPTRHLAPLRRTMSRTRSRRFGPRIARPSLSSRSACSSPSPVSCLGESRFFRGLTGSTGIGATR